MCMLVCCRFCSMCESDISRMYCEGFMLIRMVIRLKMMLCIRLFSMWLWLLFYRFMFCWLWCRLCSVYIQCMLCWVQWQMYLYRFSIIMQSRKFISVWLVMLGQIWLRLKVFQFFRCRVLERYDSVGLSSRKVMMGMMFRCCSMVQMKLFQWVCGLVMGCIGMVDFSGCRIRNRIISLQMFIRMNLVLVKVFLMNFFMLMKNISGCIRVLKSQFWMVVKRLEMVWIMDSVDLV